MSTASSACAPTPIRPNDAKVARDFGAEGIGLCRTEHMFFEAERIDAVREMILADTEQGRNARSRRSFRCRRAISTASSAR